VGGDQVETSSSSATHMETMDDWPSFVVGVPPALIGLQSWVLEARFSGQISLQRDSIQLCRPMINSQRSALSAETEVYTNRGCWHKWMGTPYVTFLSPDSRSLVNLDSKRAFRNVSLSQEVCSRPFAWSSCHSATTCVRLWYITPSGIQRRR